MFMDPDLEKGPRVETGERAGDDSIESSKASSAEPSEMRPESSTPPQNTSNDPAAACFDAEAEFKELVVKMKSTLSFDYKLFAKRDQPKNEARDAIELLYNLNMRHARIELYKDYMRDATNNFTLNSEDCGSLQQHLDRYSQTSRDYQAFVTSHGDELNTQSDVDLIEAAARLIVIEGYEQKQEQDPERAKMRQCIIDQARQELSNYYTTNFLRVDDDNVPGKSKAERDARRKQQKLYLANARAAMFGGYALIIPMLIMTLHQTTLTSLLTTSLFVFAVARILAAIMDTAEPKDIVGATAAYAAVLVVFVGTSGDKANGGLNGGAIAGIVVGSLVGGYLVLITCAVCCFKGFTDGIRAIAGQAYRPRRILQSVKGTGWASASDPVTGGMAAYRHATVEPEVIRDEPSARVPAENNHEQKIA